MTKNIKSDGFDRARRVAAPKILTSGGFRTWAMEL